MPPSPLVVIDATEFGDLLVLASSASGWTQGIDEEAQAPKRRVPTHKRQQQRQRQRQRGTATTRARSAREGASESILPLSVDEAGQGHW